MTLRPASSPQIIARSALYEMVWQAPMTMLAPKYGISATVLGNICDAHDIPRPPHGYWAKRVAGTLKSSAIPPLPRSKQKSVEIAKPVTKGELHAKAWQELRDRAVAFHPTRTRPGKKIPPPPATPAATQTARAKPAPLEDAAELPPTPPLAYSVKRLSQALSLSKPTIYKLVQQGEFHPIKVGGRTLFVASEIIEWLDRKLAEAQRE